MNGRGNFALQPGAKGKAGFQRKEDTLLGGKGYMNDVAVKESRS